MKRETARWKRKLSWCLFLLFEHRNPYFYFALHPTNYGANPLGRLLDLRGTRIITVMESKREVFGKESCWLFAQIQPQNGSLAELWGQDTAACLPLTGTRPSLRGMAHLWICLSFFLNPGWEPRIDTEIEVNLETLTEQYGESSIGSQIWKD